MQYNNKQFGEHTDALTHSSYFDDDSRSGEVPTDKFIRITAENDDRITADGDRRITANSI